MAWTNTKFETGDVSVLEWERDRVSVWKKEREKEREREREGIMCICARALCGAINAWVLACVGVWKRVIDVSVREGEREKERKGDREWERKRWRVSMCVFPEAIFWRVLMLVAGSSSSNSNRTSGFCLKMEKTNLRERERKQYWRISTRRNVLSDNSTELILETHHLPRS